MKIEKLNKLYYDDESLQKDLSPDIYCLVHNKIVNLEKQCKNQKEVIDKVVEYINQHWVIDEPILFKNDLIEILDKMQELQGSDSNE